MVKYYILLHLLVVLHLASQSLNLLLQLGLLLRVEADQVLIHGVFIDLALLIFIHSLLPLLPQRRTTHYLPARSLKTLTLLLVLQSLQLPVQIPHLVLPLPKHPLPFFILLMTYISRIQLLHCILESSQLFLHFVVQLLLGEDLTTEGPESAD